MSDRGRCPAAIRTGRLDEDRVISWNKESPKEIVRKVLRAKKLYTWGRRGGSAEVTEKGAYGLLMEI
jgi:hypothetical protein